MAVLLLAPVVGFDAVIPPQLFGSARGPDGEPLYEVTTVGLSAAPVPTSHGYQIVPGAGVDALSAVDTVIVPGTRLPSARRHGTLDDDVQAALDLIRPDARLVSICTGAFVLAAAGRLDGRPATTHWAHAQRFRRLFPAVRLDEDLLFVDDGDVLTSAGLAAGIDLCLHIIRRDHGVAVANHVARDCVVPPWRHGGQAQFIERPVPAGDDASTAMAREWALGHLGQAIDVARFAAQAQMSVRTFNRRFREETGQSPGAWLLAQRLARAQHLLEASDAPVEEVAARAGLGSAATLRQHLRATMGVSPLEYRRTFRGDGVQVAAHTTR